MIFKKDRLFPLLWVKLEGKSGGRKEKRLEIGTRKAGCGSWSTLAAKNGE